MKNYEIKRYNGSEWQLLPQVGRTVQLTRVDDPTVIDAGIRQGMDGMVVGYDTVPNTTVILIEVFIFEKHVSYYFRPDQIEVTRL